MEKPSNQVIDLSWARFLNVELEEGAAHGGTSRPEEGHAKRLEHKRLAWQSVLDSLCSASVRRAHLAKTSAKTIWSPGDLVFCWRASGRGGRGKRGEFLGAGTVLLQEKAVRDGVLQTTGVVWVAHGGQLIRVAPEHLRPATEAE